MKLRLIVGMSAFAAVCAHAQKGGQAEVALQGYYLGGGAQTLLSTTGVAVKFQEFIPDFGLIRGSLEGYRTGGSIRAADNLLELRGFRMGGMRWNLTGGDFRAPASPVQNPFSNLFFPEINARGVQIEASDGRSAYSVFYGNETLLGGPRIPFRVTVPQTALGASMRQKFGRWETGVRVLRLTTQEQNLDGNSFFFPPGRSFPAADNLSLYTAYKFNDHLRWYGEVTAARATRAPGTALDGSSVGQPVSYFFGPAWESPRITFRANYANLGRSYFPVAGYSIGGRRGPFGEIRIRPLRRLELFGSASHYETTEKHDLVLPYIRSTGSSAGAAVEFPWRFNASVQLSTIRFYSFDPKSDATQNSRNRQWTGTLSRQVRHQTLRFTGRDTRLMISSLPSRERSGEIEDTFQFRGFVLGGAIRAQESLTAERRNSIYLRGSAQVNLGRLTAYGYVEGGKDLANQTVFATNATSSSVLTASLRLSRQWNIQGEAYRSRLLATLNPESIFIEGNQGIFLNPVLNRFDQWSFLFRIVRSFNWGSALPAGGPDQYIRQQIPLIGSIEGFVHILATAGAPRPAPAVAVSLESGQSAMTDSNGRYRFESVPEGLHTVSINLEELPADYNPGTKTKSAVSVSPSRVARVDLDLYALSEFFGKVTMTSGPAFDSLEGIVVRLSPGDRHTTTLQDGSFAFYNLPDGAYEVSLVENTLPPGVRLKSPSRGAVAVRPGSKPGAVQFEIERREVEEKPIRKVLEQRIESAFPLPPEHRAIGLNDVMNKPVDLVSDNLFKPMVLAYAAPAADPPAPKLPTALPALPSAPPHAKSADAHNTYGRELLNQGRYREAIEELNAALRQRTDFPLALNARGFAYYLIHDHVRALADFDAAIRLNPKYLNAYQNRGMARKALGDMVGSNSDKQKARELKQSSGETVASS